jgi:outer membrane protein OmpA-like peptidoglycan-associated protein
MDASRRSKLLEARQNLSGHARPNRVFWDPISNLDGDRRPVGKAKVVFQAVSTLPTPPFASYTMPLAAERAAYKTVRPHKPRRPLSKFGTSLQKMACNRKEQEMSHDRMTRRLLAAVGVLSLLVGGAAVAQQTQELPAGSETYPVHFATGSAQLAPKDHDTIRGVASKMMGSPNLVATIVGKADSVGSEELNERLSEQRAIAVFEELVYTNKVPEDRVDIYFSGEHLPFVVTADERAQLQNRVVAIILE